MKKLTPMLMAAVIAGCATTQVYEGEKRGRSEVAVIKGASEWNFITSGNVIIKEVDGVEIGAGSNEVEVLPGKHVLLVKCEILSIGSFNRHALKVNVEGGRTYLLGLKVSPGGRSCEGVILEH